MQLATQPIQKILPQRNPVSIPQIETKLPKVGTTIFTVMSALATETGAVNLGQGFPDFNCDPALIDAVSDAMRQGLNQYPPMAGVPTLRQAVAQKIASLYGAQYDWNTEVTVTSGATQAILTAVLAVIKPGDEVIVLEPSYDSYVPNIELAGGVPVFVQMDDQYRVPWGKVQAAVTTKTRAVIVNSPHNPSGMIFSETDMHALEDIAVANDLIVISDEVYEHMVFDGRPHLSASSYPALASRSFVVSSFGKTFHVTGWKIATCVAPAALMAEFRKVHQFNVFTTITPVQHGLANYMSEPQRYLELPGFYQQKRDLFRAGLAKTRFKLYPSEGTFFQLVDYSAISDMPEADFAKWLTREIGVAAIPMSAFYDVPEEHQVVRFCFAKKTETLNTALERLSKI
jgi:methionine transaminase